MVAESAISKSADGVALALSESMPSLAPEARGFALTLLRLLAEGEPVTMPTFAEAVGLDRGILEELADDVPGLVRDNRGRVISFLGLSLTETPHRLELGDTTLYANCAWDALFLPRLIERTTNLRSPCAETREEVSLTVSPNAFEELSPASARVSMLVPEGGFRLDVLESFCHHVHFFTGPEAGERWLAQRQGDDAFLLTVAEAFRLGQMWTRHLLGGE